MAKDNTWFESINWDNACMKCQKANNGACPFPSCAEMHYDDNGNAMPMRYNIGGKANA